MPATATSESKTLLSFFWSQRGQFLPGMFIACGRIVVIAPFPLIFKRIVDHSMPRRDVREIGLLSLATVLLLVAHQWFSVVGASRLGASVARMLLHLRATIFEKIQYLSFTYLDRQKTGRLLAKYAFDTQKVEGVAMPILNGFVPNTLYSVLTLSVMIAMNWQLSGIVVLMLPIMGFMRWKYFKPLKARNEENRKAQEALTGTAAEYLGALRLVRSYGKERLVEGKLEESNREVARSRVDLIHVSTSFNAFSWAMVQLLSLVAVAGGALLSIYGKVTPGTVVAFVASLGPLTQPIMVFAQLADQMFNGQEAYNSINELLTESEVERWKGRQELPAIKGKIEFDHVTFRYPSADKDALSDFSLLVQPGERIALVGASGAGKSTVASLLLGLYAPDSGHIRIDGVPQDELRMRWFRQHTALVMQESVLLSGSVKENIRFARENATDAEVLDAARQANAEEFINQMPEGFETVVGERGVMLSGGQRQRLAIARALLRNPAILVLDEPTSALDYESERLIQSALDTLIKGRTVITIAHRLSTIRNADRIIVLDQGRIADQGTFTELVARPGPFSRMLSAQTGEFTDSAA